MPSVRVLGRVAVAVVIAVALSAATSLTAPTRAATQTSSSVRDLQQRLAELTFLPRSQIDGMLGPRTRHAITAFQQWHGLTPDGIAGPRTLAKLRTAHVPQPGKQGPSRRIEVYRAKGVTLLIDRGQATRVIHSSAGKRGYATPSGTYQIVRKVLKDWSYRYNASMPYASYFLGGHALHEGVVPTYPASHGCVRLPPGDAADAYRFAALGATVVVC